jgi:hypothetical protein
MSEIDNSAADDIHHITRKSKTHKNQDAIKNLIAVNRSQHDQLHARQISDEEAQDYHDRFVINFLVNNRDKIQELDETSLDYYSSKLIESDHYESIIK